jgi:hypothetical protein
LLPAKLDGYCQNDNIVRRFSKNYKEKNYQLPVVVLCINQTVNLCSSQFVANSAVVSSSRADREGSDITD